MHNIFIKSLYERPFIKFRYQVFDQSYNTATICDILAEFLISRSSTSRCYIRP